MTPEELDRLEQLEAAAAREPWVWKNWGGVKIVSDQGPRPIVMDACGKSLRTSDRSDNMGGLMRDALPDDADFALICHLRNHAKELIAAARERDELRARAGRAESALRSIRDTWDSDDINLHGIQIAHDMRSTASAALAARGEG